MIRLYTKLLKNKLERKEKSMFCPNCGSQAPDGAAVCPSCGSAMGAQENSGGTGGFDLKSNKMLIPIVGAAAVVVVIVLVVIFSAVFGSNYKTPIKKMVKTLNKKQESAMEYVAFDTPPYSVDYYKTRYKVLDNCEEYVDDNGKSKEAYEEYIEQLEDKYGDDYKITIEEIKNVEKIDKDDVKDVQKEIREDYEDKDDIEDAVEEMEDSLEYYEDEYDLSSKDAKKIVKAYEKSLKAQSKAKVSAGYEMTVEFKIKGEDDHAKYKAKNIEVYKINGKWYSSLSPYSLIYGFESE